MSAGRAVTSRNANQGVMILASRLVTNLYDYELRDAGLNVRQYTILETLATTGPVTRSDLARILLLDGATLRWKLRTLEKRRWIRTRRHDATHLRRVELTAAGRATLTRAKPAWDRAQQRVAARIGRKRLDALMVELAAISRLMFRIGSIT